MFRVACVQMEARNVSQYLQTEQEILDSIDTVCEKDDIDLIVFPECTWPAYYLGENPEAAELAHERTPQLMEHIGEKAALYGVYVAMGLYLFQGRSLRNAGVLWNPQGQIAGRVYKSNLWHFDSKYVAPGEEFPVIETPLGKIGLMICADGRAPEIARILSLKGAEVIIDMTNLVTSGSDPTVLNNPQIEYMLPVRAYENGVWIIVCDKIGLEAYTVLNTGRSCIINPYGHIVAEASPNQEEVITAAIDTSITLPPHRLYPEHCFFSRLGSSLESLPILSFTKELTAFTGLLCSVAQFSWYDEEHYFASASRMIRILQDQDSSLILLPDSGEAEILDRLVHYLQPLLSSGTVVCLSGKTRLNGEERKAMVGFSKDNFYGPALYQDDHDPMVFQTEAGRLGFIVDDEMSLPEKARCLMLEGAQVFLWSDSFPKRISRNVAQCRGAENKVFLMRNIVADEDSSLIISPSGSILAAALPGKDQCISSYIVPVEAYNKTVIPGTNVVTGRQPNFYKNALNALKERQDREIDG